MLIIHFRILTLPTTQKELLTPLCRSLRSKCSRPALDPILM